LTHGDQNPPSAGETPEIRPDDGVRQPDFGSVPAVAADEAADEPPGSGDDGKRLEKHGGSPDGRDDQREPDVHGDVPDVRGDDPDGQAAVLEALEVQLEERQWSGPLPPPSTLYQYEQVQAGLAERIVSMAETMATGEIKTRDKLADAEIERARTGQALAFLLTIIALGASIYFFAARNPVAGAALLSFPVIMLIRSFLTSIRGESVSGRDGDSPPPAPGPPNG
jgi:uncharacterized membrane protein